MEETDIQAAPENGVQDDIELRLLTEQEAVFAASEGGFVTLDLAGRHYPRVAFYRAFPFTAPDEWISVREFDKAAAEIGLIERLGDWSAPARELIGGQIALRYFTPKITAIRNIKNEYGYAHFDVETDKGPCRFTVNMHEGGVVSLSETYILIRDLDGNRFAIENLQALTSAEIRRLDIYI